MTTQPPAPALELKIERGNPTPEELAAVIAVLHQRLTTTHTTRTAETRRPPTPARWHRQQPTPFQPRAWRSIQFQRAA
ncbi:acyl-CoA carboxylase subunit epsilon [Streptomyces sp. NBC_01356]|uniref:acyl-CoA carboxylase subunit epsilon n=1 Tax=Streptomyces sp. NBC_01356 TaxID=2903836 RepID=UPI002E30E3D1|nr:acyl-CoA carboxylase subunit epsilon [Streptomyces sp. NBC_01356]